MSNKKIKNGLCICTPFYGEDVKVQYMTSLVETYAEFQRAGIHLMNIYLYNTSLITKARNTLASKRTSPSKMFSELFKSNVFNLSGRNP